MDRGALMYMMGQVRRRVGIDPRAKMTLVIRMPDDVEADIVITADDLNEVAKVIDRTKERELRLPPRCQGDGT